MKRSLAGILILSLLLCCAAPLTHAEQTPTPEPMPADALDAPSVPISDAAEPDIPLVHIGVEAVPADASGEAQVALTIENGNGVDSLQCNLNYNGDAMTVKSVTAGVTFPAEYCVTNLNEKGRVRLAAACALGLDNENGTVVILHCKLTGDAGSAITLSDVIVTTVGAEYVQSKAYVTIADGGVTASGGTLAQSGATPWIPETPEPPATPAPPPTEAPAPAVVEAPAATAEPTPEPAPEAPSMRPYIIAGVLAVLLAAGLVILLVGSRNKKKRRRKKGGKNGNAKNAGAGKSRSDPNGAERKPAPAKKRRR